MLNKKANLLSKPDAYYNIENFGTGTGKQNVLYVSGYSGGGKSTVGKQIAEQHGASYIELDALHTMKDSDKKHKIVEQYFKENPHLVKDGKGISGIDYNYKSQQFLPYLRDYVKKHPDEKFVVEGIQTLNSKDPNVPRVVKGTGLLESTRRAATRNAAQGRKGDIPLALNAYLYPQIKKERKFIQNTIRNTDYAQGRLGRAQKIMDISAKAAKKAGVAGLALAGAATLANNEINKRVKRKGDTDMRKSAYEMLDEAIEKIAKRDNKRDGNDAVRKTLGVGALGAGGTGLYYANKDKAVAEAAMKSSSKSMKKAKSGAIKAGGLGISTAISQPIMDQIMSKSFGLPKGSVNMKHSNAISGMLSAANGGIAAKDYMNAKKQTSLANKALKNAKLKGAAGVAGLGLGAGTLLASNRNKEAFEILDDAIEKIAERDNKNVAKGIGGASLIGAGGAGLYYANKDREAAEAAVKKAKKYSKKSTGQAVKAGLAAGIGAGSYGLAYKNRRGDEVERAVLKGLGNLNTAAAGVNLGALSMNKGKSKAQKELAERTLKNAKLKGAAGVAGLGLGAGTLLAANRKKD